MSMPAPQLQMPDSPSGFDCGPLSWVRDEIEHSLASAITHLDGLAAAPGNSRALKHAGACVHQVSGALSMVGLGAAARLCEEIEKLIASFEPVAAAKGSQALQTARQAMGSLSAYLDELMAGRPDYPMVLAACYLAVNKARGANDASVNDLFSPDLSALVPACEVSSPRLSDDERANAIRWQRSRFQGGLLKLLRDKDLPNGVAIMRLATEAIENLPLRAAERSFWFTASGFLEAVGKDPAGAGQSAVQLFGKIDQQIKLMLGGNDHVPEKLFRDLLLVIGNSAARSERISEIRATYRLDELLAAADAGVEPKADSALVATIDALREKLAIQKENLLAFTRRDQAAIEPFALLAERLAMMAEMQPNRELVQLLQILAAVGKHVRKTGKFLSEAQALELASAMLFVESSLENYFKLTAEFAGQATTVSTRLRNVMSGVELPATKAAASSLGDTMTLRAQTQLLVFQVGREVEVNLNTIESTLDGFFRDPAKVADIAPLEALLKQVEGALSMLELEQAAALSGAVAQRVARFASGEIEGKGDAATDVAEGVSALGMYIKAVMQNAADPAALLMPVLVRLGLAEKPAAKKRLARVKLAAVPVPVPPAAPATGLGAVNVPASPAPVAAGQLSPQRRASDNAALAVHRMLHLAIDQVIGADADSLASAVDGRAGNTQSPASLSPADPVQGIHTLVLEMKAVIAARDQRIQALEAMVAKLRADARKALAQ